MKKMKTNLPSPCKLANTYYIWLGGSCDYGREERFGGGAYVMEYDGRILEQYVITDTATTEFRMMLTVMIHAMEILPPQSYLCFLTNVSYLQNFDKTPTDKSANGDLIQQCITAKDLHKSVQIRIIPYHKYEQLTETHRIAHEAMLKLRQRNTK